jgi:hypothetical protein
VLRLSRAADISKVSKREKTPGPEPYGRTWPDLISEAIHGPRVLIVRLCIILAMLGGSGTGVAYLIVRALLTYLPHR